MIGRKPESDPPMGECFFGDGIDDVKKLGVYSISGIFLAGVLKKMYHLDGCSC